MLKNVGTVLDNNPELTMARINLAMHSAITTHKTYLADKELDPTEVSIRLRPPEVLRAHSEFFQRIGNEHTLSLKMAKACATHLEDGEILALDGTRVECNSGKCQSCGQSARKRWFRMALRSTLLLVINVKNG